MTLFLMHCRSGVVKSLLLGFSMCEWPGEQLTIGVLYLPNVTQTHNKCGALPKVDVQPYRPHDQSIKLDVD